MFLGIWEAISKMWKSQSQVDLTKNSNMFLEFLSVRLAKNTSKIPCRMCIKQRQTITVSNPLNITIKFGYRIYFYNIIQNIKKFVVVPSHPLYPKINVILYLASFISFKTYGNIWILNKFTFKIFIWIRYFRFVLICKL